MGKFQLENQANLIYNFIDKLARLNKKCDNHTLIERRIKKEKLRNINQEE